MQLHLAKLSKESVERGRNEDLKALTKRAQMREEELNSYIEDVGDQHGKLPLYVPTDNKLVIFFNRQ